MSKIDIEKGTQSYILSFCIPQYNDYKLAKIQAEDILMSTNPFIQVVISDNNSTMPEGYYDELKKDSRFKFVRNQENVGSELNMANALIAGDGEYLYLSVAHDRIKYWNIEKLLEGLNRAKNDDIYCVLDRASTSFYTVLSGEILLNEFVEYNHPGGIIFSKERLEHIDVPGIMKDGIGKQPWEALKAEVVLPNKKGAIIDSGVFSGASDFLLAKIISLSKESYDGGNYKKFPYMPEGALMGLYYRLDTVLRDNRFNLSWYERCLFFMHKYRNTLNLVTITKKYDTEIEEIAIHKEMRARYVSIEEQISDVRFIRKNVLKNGRYRSLFCGLELLILNVLSVLKILRQ